MKQIKGSFKIVCAAFLLLFALPLQGLAESKGIQERDSILQQMDSVEISLLTVGPGNEVWSLYGHTAIRFQNHLNGTDVAINYGSFTFDQPFFALRFVFGLTDYEMAIVPMKAFMQEYTAEKRWVVQQDLNLTRLEKQQIANALQQNSLPQNVTYRYNFFYDNCTTRAYNIITNNLNGILDNSDNQWNNESYRKMTHQWTVNHRWTRFGNDLLLGIKADFPTKKEASLFLPDSTRKCFNQMFLTDEGTQKKRKLVKDEKWLIHPFKKNLDLSVSSFLSPSIVLGSLFVFILLLSLLQWKARRKVQGFMAVDALLLFITGVAGVILLLMVFSQHPTVRVNLQILLLNPLSLLFLFPVIKAESKKKAHGYWKVLAGCLLLFLLGGIWQTYAEGMYFVALSLLIRCLTNIRYEK